MRWKTVPVFHRQAAATGSVTDSGQTSSQVRQKSTDIN